MFTTWDLVSICFYDGVNKPTIFNFIYHIYRLFTYVKLEGISIAVFCGLPSRDD